MTDIGRMCSGCREMKDVSEFGSLASSRDGINQRCKECMRLKDRAAYRASAARRSAQARRTTERRLRARRYIYEYLTKNPCVDCGVSNPLVLSFDHRDQATKSFNIGDVNAISIARLISEIEKCDVRCANCHLIRTAAQLGWYKYLESEPDGRTGTAC